MPLEVTPRAREVLRRALSLARLDAASVGVRVTVARGSQGDEARTAFAEQPEPGDEVLELEGLRLFVAADLWDRGGVLDVEAEHERIVVR